jgi:hypothetical protein
MGCSSPSDGSADDAEDGALPDVPALDAARDGASSDASPADTGAAPSDAMPSDTSAPGDTLVDSRSVPPDTATTADTSRPAGERLFTFVNKCSATVWVGALTGDPKFRLPEGGGFRLDPKASHSFSLPVPWGGRFWGRSGCTFDASGKGKCTTGDCGGRAQCNGIGGATPASLAEFFLGGAGGKDFYDVSLVDGYNLPIGVAPVTGTFTKTGTDPYDCGAPSCIRDLNPTCPAELQQKDSAGNVVGCLSACEKFNTDAYCCRGAYGRRARSPAAAPTT